MVSLDKDTGIVEIPGEFRDPPHLFSGRAQVARDHLVLPHAAQRDKSGLYTNSGFCGQLRCIGYRRP